VVRHLTDEHAFSRIRAPDGGLAALGAFRRL